MEYAKLVALMQTDRLDRRKAAPKISQLREIRELSMKTARRVRDYMDWYEINTRTGSGKTFDSYAATMKLIREQEAPANTPIDDIDTYSQVSRRLKTEDVFSIVDTYFMPYGIECDLYSIMGEILAVRRRRNRSGIYRPYGKRTACAPFCEGLPGIRVSMLSSL